MLNELFGGRLRRGTSICCSRICEGPVVASILAASAICFGSVTAAAAEGQKVEVLFPPSAAQVAQSVTQALSASNYDLKEAQSADALAEFCKPGNAERPMLLLSSTEMETHMEDDCGSGKVAKAELGYLTLVLVQKAADPAMSLTAKQIYLGIAEVVPTDEALDINKTGKWSDVDPALPDLPIKVLLPAESDPTRHVFDGEVLVAGCREFPAIREIFDADARTARCLTLRRDGVETSQNDAERLAALEATGPGAVTIVANRGELEAGNLFRIVPFNGMLPTPEDIAAEDYTLTVPLFLYAHAEQLSGEGLIETVRAWFMEAISERAIGTSSYLDQFGFAGVPAATRDWQRRALAE